MVQGAWWGMQGAGWQLGDKNTAHFAAQTCTHSHVKQGSDQTDAVVHIPVGWPEATGCDTDNVLDELLSVVELCKRLLVAKRGPAKR